MKDWLLLETTPDGGGGDGGTGAPPDGDDGDAAWTGPTEAEWQQTQVQLADAAALVEAVRSQQQGDGGPLGDYDPEFRQALDQYIEQKLSPYAGFQQEAILGEAEQRALDILTDISKSGVEFDIADARLRADQLLPEFSAKYGPGPKAAEAALAEAAVQQREKEALYEKRGEERYVNQSRRLYQAPVEPAAGAVNGAAQHVTPEGGDERDLVRAYFPSSR